MPRPPHQLTAQLRPAATNAAPSAQPLSLSAPLSLSSSPSTSSTPSAAVDVLLRVRLGGRLLHSGRATAGSSPTSAATTPPQPFLPPNPSSPLSPPVRSSPAASASPRSPPPPSRPSSDASSSRDKRSLPPPVSQPARSERSSDSDSDSDSDSRARRIPPWLPTALATMLVLLGVQWFRVQFSEEQAEWLRQYELEQAQKTREVTAAALVQPAVPAAQPSPAPPVVTVPAWCDSEAKVQLWQSSERLLALTRQLIPPPVERAILASSNSSPRPPSEQHNTSAPMDAEEAFGQLSSALSSLRFMFDAGQSDNADKEQLLSAFAGRLPHLQRSLLLLALHPLLPPSIRSQSLSLIDSASSSSPALSESFVSAGGSSLVGHVAYHSPISPALFTAYQRQLQHQHDAFHQQQLVDALTAASDERDSAPHALGSEASGALCEVDELLSVLKSMPNLHRHLHAYLRKQQQEDDRGAGAESTLPSLHPSLAREDLEVLNRIPIELTARPVATPTSTTAEVLSSASHAVSSLVTSFLARYTYSYNAVQQGLVQQMERRRVDDHFHAVRLLASMCEQAEVCQYLTDRGLIPLLARWYERGGLSREMRVKVQIARLVANANSHPSAVSDVADACLQSPLMLELADWAHSDPLQSDDHFLPVHLPIPPETNDIYAALAHEPTLASPPSPAALPTRNTLTVQNAVDVLSTFRHTAPARLHQLRQDVVSSITSLSSSLPPAMRSRLPSPTSSLPAPDQPLSPVDVPISGAAAASSVAVPASGGVKSASTVASSPPRVGGSADGHSSLLNVLNSQAVRALANLHAQMERKREHSVCAALQQQQNARTDGGHRLWQTLLSKGRSSHPLYCDEVYLVHPAFAPLASPASASSAPLSSSPSSTQPSSNPTAASLPPVWYPSTPVLDIVFVHGLLGNPLRTWRLHTSHDEKVAAKDRQMAAADSSADSREADPAEAQLHAQYSMAQQLREFIASRRQSQSSPGSATSTAASHSVARISLDSGVQTTAVAERKQVEAVSVAGADGTDSRDDDEVEEEEEEEEKDAQSSDAEIIWPRDWLPSALPENVRILSIGFRSSLLHEHDNTGNSLVERAQQFIHKLDVAAIPSSAHPASSPPAPPNVVWITHSMGGLLAKQMLYASRPLLDSTLGLVFLATPHAGAWLPKTSTTRALFGYIVTPSVELDQLEENSPHLLALNQHMQQHIAQQRYEERLRVLSMGEGQPTPLPPNRPASPFSLLLVPSKSSNPGYGEFVQLDEENHLNICKPRAKDSAMFRTLVAFIRERMQHMHDVDRRREGGTDSHAAVGESTVAQSVSS